MRTPHLLAAFSLVLGTAAPAAWEDLPLLPSRLVVQESALEIDAGRSWAKKLDVPRFGADEQPVLALRARVQTPGGGGCNFVLQVLLDGAPLTESILRPRLLNKRPDFDPPGTEYHFS